MRRLMWWSTLCVSVCVVVLNIGVLLQHDPTFTTANSGGIKIGSDFFSSRKVVEETLQQAPSSSSSSSSSSLSLSHDRMTQTKQHQQNQQQQQNQQNHRLPRTLIGIITADNRNDCAYRKRHRLLFEIWNDTRVCSLPELKSRHTKNDEHDCQVVYTFIMGANPDPNAATEIIDSSVPILYPHAVQSNFDDVNNPDMSLLNIRENMNEGKSQTFFYYASLLLQEYKLDYAMKLDGDSILHLHDFLLFAHSHLPPAPYNTNIIAGALRDKAGWPPNNQPDQLPRLESHFGNEFEGVHLYLAGQCYLMSLDLCLFVAQEAPFSKIRVAQGGYLEGHEDHDISAMAFHSPTPIHMITIGKSQRFWEHPVKGQPRWDRIQKRETARIHREEFEGKILRLY